MRNKSKHIQADTHRSVTSGTRMGARRQNQGQKDRRVKHYVLVQVCGRGETLHYLDALTPGSWPMAVSPGKKACLSEGVGGRMGRHPVDNVYPHPSTTPQKTVNTSINIELCKSLKSGEKDNLAQ